MPDAGALRAKEIVGLIAGAGPEEFAVLKKRYAGDARKQVQVALARAEARLQREEDERSRVRAMYATMREAGGPGIVIGVDEVGRGAVAGPLTVAAVALPDDPILWGINDSKQLTPARREALAQDIEDVALCIGIAHIAPQQIDTDGMALCLRKAMADAIRATGVEPDCVLIDGNPVHVHERERCIVKGDASVACIAAASIVAKVTRDAMMGEYDELYPEYHWRSCKGYASPEHIEAIRTYGLTPLHRASFCGGFVENLTLF